MNQVLFALWFFLPAGLANSAPVFASKLPGLRKLNAPIDFGRTWRGERIFGAHKTWRGLLSGLVVATLTLWVQVILFRHVEWAQTIARQVDYNELPALLLAALFGLGALVGDSIESFIKRRLAIPSGKSWFPFDQIDYIIGGLLASSLVIRLQPLEYVTILVVWFVLHIVSTFIGYYLHLREAKI